MENQRHGERQAVVLSKRKPHGERWKRGKSINWKPGSLPVRDYLKQTDRQTDRLYYCACFSPQLLLGSWRFNLIKQKQQSGMETPGVIKTTSLDRAKYGWNIDLCICLNFRLSWCFTHFEPHNPRHWNRYLACWRAPIIDKYVLKVKTNNILISSVDIQVNFKGWKCGNAHLWQRKKKDVNLPCIYCPRLAIRLYYIWVWQNGDVAEQRVSSYINKKMKKIIKVIFPNKHYRL